MGCYKGNAVRVPVHVLYRGGESLSFLICKMRLISSFTWSWRLNEGTTEKHPEQCPHRSTSKCHYLWGEKSCRKTHRKPTGSNEDSLPLSIPSYGTRDQKNASSSSLPHSIAVTSNPVSSFYQFSTGEALSLMKAVFSGYLYNSRRLRLPPNCFSQQQFNLKHVRTPLSLADNSAPIVQVSCWVGFSPLGGHWRLFSSVALTQYPFTFHHYHDISPAAVGVLSLFAHTLEFMEILLSSFVDWGFSFCYPA